MFGELNIDDLFERFLVAERNERGPTKIDARLLYGILYATRFGKIRYDQTAALLSKMSNPNIRDQAVQAITHIFTVNECVYLIEHLLPIAYAHSDPESHPFLRDDSITSCLFRVLTYSQSAQYAEKTIIPYLDSLVAITKKYQHESLDFFNELKPIFQEFVQTFFTTPPPDFVLATSRKISELTANDDVLNQIFFLASVLVLRLPQLLINQYFEGKTTNSDTLEAQAQTLATKYLIAPLKKFFSNTHFSAPQLRQNPCMPQEIWFNASLKCIHEYRDNANGLIDFVRANKLYPPQDVIIPLSGDDRIFAETAQIFQHFYQDEMHLDSFVCYYNHHIKPPVLPTISPTLLDTILHTLAVNPAAAEQIICALPSDTVKSVNWFATVSDQPSLIFQLIECGSHQSLAHLGKFVQLPKNALYSDTQFSPLARAIFLCHSSQGSKHTATADNTLAALLTMQPDLTDITRATGDEHTGKNALHYAISLANTPLSTIKVLIEHLDKLPPSEYTKILTQAWGSHQDTPQTLAARFNRHDIQKYFQEKLSLNATNRRGQGMNTVADLSKEVQKSLRSSSSSRLSLHSSKAAGQPPKRASSLKRSKSPNKFLRESMKQAPRATDPEELKICFEHKTHFFTNLSTEYLTAIKHFAAICTQPWNYSSRFIDEITNGICISLTSKKYNGLETKVLGHLCLVAENYFPQTPKLQNMKSTLITTLSTKLDELLQGNIKQKESNQAVYLIAVMTHISPESAIAYAQRSNVQSKKDLLFQAIQSSLHNHTSLNYNDSYQTWTEVSAPLEHLYQQQLAQYNMPASATGGMFSLGYQALNQAAS